MTRTLGQGSYFLKFERIVDEESAVQAWKSYVRAHGWSPVGEPYVLKPEPGEPDRLGYHGMIGTVVRTDRTIEINPDIDKLATIRFP